ncbi:hypothetical protein OB920_11470 [Halobacteria archaeon HArc-gm2]|nr:hypothetical protein [Halobacteria archaeon HArc-gm2]
MGVVSYAGVVGIVIVVGFAIPRFEPAVVDHLSRQVELDRTKGIGLFAVAVLWMFLPLLGGAEAGEGELWVAGSAVAGGGFYLVAVAASSLDEHRLLDRATRYGPDAVPPGASDDVVAISGVPSVERETDATTPFSGVPAVHTEWMVQRRRRIGFRKTWSAIASGVEHVPFTLGDGAVRVEAGRARAFTDAELHRTVDPDEDLPSRTDGAFLRDHEALPDPDDREKSLTLIEQFVPADEHVTVVGTPRQGGEPGQVVVDEAPPDDLLGTHADYTAGDGSEADAVLIRGDLDAAASQLRRRVYGAGILGGIMVIGGQLLAFWLSPATLSGLF